MIGKASENMINGTRFIAVTGGCLKILPCKTSMFIRNSWYEDKDFGPGDMSKILGEPISTTFDPETMIVTVKFKI